MKAMKKATCQRAVFCALPALVACVCAIGLVKASVSNTEAEKEREFRALYKAWDASIYEIPEKVWQTSDLREQAVYQENEHCQKLVALGPEVIPLMIEAGQEDTQLLHIVEMICKRRFPYHRDREASSFGKSVFIIEGVPGFDQGFGRPKFGKIWLYWWNEVREQTPELFAGHYEEWKALRDEGKTEEAAKKLESIENLGIDALPSVMEAVAAGDKDMVPVAAYLADVPWFTGTKASDAMTCDECVAWWKANKAHYAMPPFEKIVVEEKAGSDDETTAAQ